MSRIGAQPIVIPDKVKVKLSGEVLEVSGPLGSLKQAIRSEIKLKIEEKKITVERVNDSQIAKSLHGLIRTLIANMILGVTQGFTKDLEIQGTGYRAKLEGGQLVLAVGFSHPVIVEPPEGIKFAVKDEKEIIVSGIDKILVGNMTAKIRKIKPPDAYKGKGIRYLGERIKLKPGKAGKAGAAGVTGA